MAVCSGTLHFTVHNTSQYIHVKWHCTLTENAVNIIDVRTNCRVSEASHLILLLVKTVILPHISWSINESLEPSSKWTYISGRCFCNYFYVKYNDVRDATKATYTFEWSHKKNQDGSYDSVTISSYLRISTLELLAFSIYHF